MKTHTHTPGPWKVLEHARGRGRTCITTTHVSPISAVICEIDVKSVLPDAVMRLANARLIASAPELLAALHDLLANAESKERYARMILGTETGEETANDLDSPEMAKARAAIAKAEGAQ